MNENIVLVQQLQKQFEVKVKDGVIIFSDLDGTLLPAKKYRQTNKFPDLLNASKKVITTLSHLNIPLVPVTGRSLNDLTRTLEFHDLNKLGSPFPMHIYSAGRNIQYRAENDNWQEDFEYEVLVNQRREILSNGACTLYEEFEQTLSEMSITATHFIPRDQNPHDSPFRTYIYEGTVNTVDNVTKVADNIITKHNLNDMRHSTSEIEAHPTVSKFAHSFQPLDKADAINYVLAQISRFFPERNICGITIGNSGNDFSMLMEGGTYGCIVGDSTDELMAQLHKLPTTIKSDFIEYMTQHGTRKIYHGTEIGPKTIINLINEKIIPMTSNLEVRIS